MSFKINRIDLKYIQSIIDNNIFTIKVHTNLMNKLMKKFNILVFFVRYVVNSKNIKLIKTALCMLLCMFLTLINIDYKRLGLDKEDGIILTQNLEFYLMIVRSKEKYK